MIPGQFRDPSGSTCSIKNWKLIVRDINWKPLQPTEARRQLNNAVLHNYHDKTVALEIGMFIVQSTKNTEYLNEFESKYILKKIGDAYKR